MCSRASSQKPDCRASVRPLDLYRRSFKINHAYVQCGTGNGGSHKPPRHRMHRHPPPARFSRTARSCFAGARAKTVLWILFVVEIPSSVRTIARTKHQPGVHRTTTNRRRGVSVVTSRCGSHRHKSKFRNGEHWNFFLRPRVLLTYSTSSHNQETQATSQRRDQSGDQSGDHTGEF